jgi:hypothetical protein
MNSNNESQANLEETGVDSLFITGPIFDRHQTTPTPKSPSQISSPKSELDRPITPKQVVRPVSLNQIATMEANNSTTSSQRAMTPNPIMSGERSTSPRTMTPNLIVIDERTTSPIQSLPIVEPPKQTPQIITPQRIPQTNYWPYSQHLSKPEPAPVYGQLCSPVLILPQSHMNNVAPVTLNSSQLYKLVDVSINVPVRITLRRSSKQTPMPIASPTGTMDNPLAISAPIKKKKTGKKLQKKIVLPPLIDRRNAFNTMNPSAPLYQSPQIMHPLRPMNQPSYVTAETVSLPPIKNLLV